MAADGLHGVFSSVKMDSCGDVVVRLSDWTRDSSYSLERSEKYRGGKEMRKENMTSK